MEEVQVPILLPTSVVVGADEWSINQVYKDEQGHQQTPEGCPANQRFQVTYAVRKSSTRDIIPECDSSWGKSDPLSASAAFLVAFHGYWHQAIHPCLRQK